MKIAVTLLVAVMLAASDLLLADEPADTSALRALDQSYAKEWIEGEAEVPPSNYTGKILGFRRFYSQTA